MKIVYNNIVPIPGFQCLNLFGILFVRKKFKGTLTGVNINHEEIHSAQFRDLLYIIYYPVYVIFWIIEILAPPYRTAYRDTCFEREAYANEDDIGYLKKRKPFGFMKYWKK